MTAVSPAVSLHRKRRPAPARAARPRHRGSERPHRPDRQRGRSRPLKLNLVAEPRRLSYVPLGATNTQETKMKLALIGAAAVAATAFATPVLAQAVVEDPGYCAQFYPNAN